MPSRRGRRASWQEGPREPRPRGNSLRFARPIVTATTMLAVVAMAFATSVPANALLSDEDLVDIRAAASSTSFTGDGEQAQRMNASDAAAAAITRDNYTAQSAVVQEFVDRFNVPAGAISANSAVRWPVDGLRVSDGFGPRRSPCSGCSSMHLGTDFLPGEGSPVYAIADGVVTDVVQSDVGLGVHVVIEHLVDGDIITTTSAHMQFGSVRVGVGDAVSSGTVIGQVGNTGASTGPHLHFELRLGGTEPVDAYGWIAARAG